MSFEAGDPVDRQLHGPMVTHEDAEVLKVDEDGVWLDNGEGNRPSGPFDPETGWHAEDVFGTRQKIELKHPDDHPSPQ